MTLAFNGFISELVTLGRGINQGCPLSGILFQFYNSDLIDGYGLKNSEAATAFIADLLMLEEANTKLASMMTWPQGRLDWSSMHHCSFTLNKFRVMGFTRKRELNLGSRPHTRPIPRLPISLGGVEVPAI